MEGMEWKSIGKVTCGKKAVMQQPWMIQTNCQPSSMDPEGYWAKFVEGLVIKKFTAVINKSLSGTALNETFIQTMMSFKHLTERHQLASSKKNLQY